MPASTARKGDTLGALNCYEEALVAYWQGIGLDPNNAQAYAGSGTIFYMSKRYEEAFAAIEQAIRLDPNNARLYSKQGDILEALDRYEEALSAYEQAIGLDPNNAQAYTGGGGILFMLRRYQEALFAYERAIRLNPNDASLYSKKGDTLKALRRYEEALSAYEQAIGLDPNNAQATTSGDNALSILGRYQEALTFFGRAHNLDDTSSNISEVHRKRLEIVRKINNKERWVLIVSLSILLNYTSISTLLSIFLKFWWMLILNIFVFVAILIVITIICWVLFSFFANDKMDEIAEHFFEEIVYPISVGIEWGWIGFYLHNYITSINVFLIISACFFVSIIYNMLVIRHHRVLKTKINNLILK